MCAHVSGHMLVAALLRRGLGLTLPLAVACTIYLYLYPAFSRCAFPLPSRDAAEAFDETKRLHWPYADDADAAPPSKLAPFRLLALGDPSSKATRRSPSHTSACFRTSGASSGT